MCTGSIRSFAFCAKLLTAGVLDASDLDWVFKLMFDYLKEPSPRVSDLAWSGRIATAAQPILLSGEAAAKNIKERTQKQHKTINAEAWRKWALKFQKEASAEREDRYDAKGKAARAYSRMVELWPEAFDEVADAE